MFYEIYSFKPFVYQAHLIVYSTIILLCKITMLKRKIIVNINRATEQIFIFGIYTTVIDATAELECVCVCVCFGLC